MTMKHEYRLELFSERVLELRLKHRWSQEKLGQRLDAGQALISSYEVGRQMPLVANLIKLCEVLDTTPNYLLGWDQEE